MLLMLALSVLRMRLARLRVRGYRHQRHRPAGVRCVCVSRVATRMLVSKRLRLRRSELSLALALTLGASKGVLPTRRGHRRRGGVHRHLRAHAHPHVCARRPRGLRLALRPRRRCIAVTKVVTTTAAPGVCEREGVCPRLHVVELQPGIRRGEGGSAKRQG